MHECTIGLYHWMDFSDTVTLAELKQEIESARRSNLAIDRLGFPSGVRKEYSLTDYADRRKSTNLTRFEYCPCCGKKIDWKGIRNNGHN